MTDRDHARIVKRLFEKIPMKVITNELACGKSWIYLIRKLLLDGRSLRGGPPTGRHGIMDDTSLRRLWKALEDVPNLTPERLTQLFSEQGPSGRSIEWRIGDNPYFFSGWKLAKPFLSE